MTKKRARRMNALIKTRLPGLMYISNTAVAKTHIQRSLVQQAHACAPYWYCSGLRSPSWMEMQPDSVTALIVDCGSGFTRAAVFFSDSGGIYSLEAHCYAGRQHEPWRQCRIVDALVEGGSTLREWVAGLQALRGLTGCTTTIVGATGGLRQAVIDGKVTLAMLSALSRLLHELVPGATYRGLSGDEEAQLELTSVQYVARTLPLTVVRPFGMISAGGMTSQVGWHEAGAASPSFLSVTTGLNDAAKALREQAAQPADARLLEPFDSRLADAVRATGRCGTLRGTFVVIEMVGGMGSATEYDGCFAALAQQIGGRLVTKAELAGALRCHLDGWQAKGGPMAHRNDAYCGLLPAGLLRLLALTDDAATFYVCRAFEVAPGEFLKPSWALGLFVTMYGDAHRLRSPHPLAGSGLMGAAWRPLLLGVAIAMAGMLLVDLRRR